MTVAHPPLPAARDRIRWPLALLALLFVGAGVLHFVIPEQYERIVPPWLPSASLLVAVSGVAELLGGLGLLWSRTRRAAGWGLIALLIAVFPANVHMLNLAIESHASAGALAALWLRLPLQVVLIWWVWRSAIRRASKR